MANTFKVTNKDGKVEELPILTPDEIADLVSKEKKDPKALRVGVDYLKALGRKVSEIANMDAEERKAFVLERYKELGVTAGGKKGAATATKAAGAKATPVTGKKAAAAAATPPPDDDDDDDDDAETETEEEDAEEAASNGVELAELHEKVDILTSTVTELSKFVLETQAVLRAVAPMITGFTEEDIAELAQAHHGTLSYEPAEEGNA